MSVRTRISDPHSVPVVGNDAHLPALPRERLTARALRTIPPRRWLDGYSPWIGDGRAPSPKVSASSSAQPEAVADAVVDAVAEGVDPADASLAAAAVLVPLVDRDGELQVLLTRRAEHLKAHPGQISFPGGRAEPTDPDVVETALREAEEEIGLSRVRVEVLGRMPAYTTVTRFQVTPVVALVHPPFDLQVDALEVAEAFEVPLDFLMNPAHHRRHRFFDAHGERQFLSIPWRRVTPPEAEREFFIWGATAAMLRNLYELLAADAGYHRG